MNEDTKPAEAQKRTIHRGQLKRYAPEHGTLIPLHAHDAQSASHGHVRKDGKRPIHTDWTKRPYSSKKVLEQCIKRNLNVGVRLNADVLVIDIDPRNGGDEGWDNFTMEFGLDESTWPCVITGSGGRHYYLHKPADVPVVDTLKDFPGVEFKSKGRQVVAAGSIHPDTLEYYRWNEDGPDPATLPMIPDALLVHIRRPQRPAVTSGGQLDQEQAADVLARLDPTKFRDHDRWLKCMMGFHHATSGDARQEFVDWSISDPHYSDQAEMIGRRWDSLHRTRAEGVITMGTLRHFLAEAGALDVLPPDQEGAHADFADADDADLDTYISEEDSALNELNKKHCAVFSGGRYRIMHREGGTRWAAASKADFVSRYENQSIENGKRGKGNPAVISLGKAWQEWPGRKTADGTTFDPQAEPASIVGGALNLWSGFAIESKAGSWDHYRNMIRDDLCDGNAEVFSYVLNWTAWKLQNPGLLPETSISFIGPKGTGKTTYGEGVAKIFGEHGLVVADISQIVGRFNGHLETKCFAYLDEAVWGGDKRNESALKKLITDTNASYEYKGVDIFDGINHVGVISGGNEEWQVPASMDERRFCVSRVSNVHRVPDDAPAGHPNRLYWNRVHCELESGGLAAFLHDLLRLDLNGWHPRVGIPRTAAMGEQKLHGLTGVSKWWYEILRDGDLPNMRTDTEEAAWSGCSLRCSPTNVTARYCEWLHFKNPHANASSKAVLEELKAWGWEGGEDQHREPTRERSRYWLMPSIKEGRARFAARIGTNPFADG